MDDLIAEFLIEAAESLEVVDQELVRFEADPRDRATLDNIFRLVHTIKGTCGFLALPRLEAVAHAGETLLGRFRDGSLAVTPEAVTLVLRSVDRIKGLLAALERDGAEPEGADADLIAALEAAAEGRGASCPEPEPEPEAGPESDAGYDAALGRALRPGEVSLAELEAAFRETEGPALPAPVPTGLKPASDPAPAAAVEPSQVEPGVAAQSIRVGVDVLEDLMTLVSELVLTRNQLLQIARRAEGCEFGTPLQRLSSITGELQDSVMKTRMQPIGAAWKKLPRLVRDVARELGKSVDLSLDGEATELDRQVLELIRDPLTHMVRNSVDHGLETPEERLAAGKPATGTIRLSAFHEGGCIVVRLSDDGRGLDTARIREKAIERGLVGRAEAEAMTDAQVHRFIFAPGFSTATTVTAVSGRGVGMDVVRANIEQIGGQIDLASTQGRGTVVTIKIPLTLAIVSALIVGAGGQRFAMPQAAVLELVRVGEGAEHRVETVDSVGVLRLRERLLPLVDLAPALALVARADGRPRFVLVMQVGERRFGLVVDDVHDTEEIVVKPLAGVLRDVPAFSGATILGDGSVVLILDPNGLSEYAGQEVEDAEGTAATSLADARVDAAGEVRALLVLRAGSGAPKAVDLAKVTRLEQVDAGRIERADGRATLQYRDRLTPILMLDPQSRLRETGCQPLIVLTGEGYALALAVDEIVDVVEERLDVELAAARPGVVGTAVVSGRATEVLDLDHFLVIGLSERRKHNSAERAAA